jgi:hypothetical protein
LLLVAIILILLGSAKIMFPEHIRRYKTYEIFDKSEQRSNGAIYFERFIGVISVAIGIVMLLQKFL